MSSKGIQQFKAQLSEGLKKGFSFWKKLPRSNITQEELMACKIDKRIGDASVFGSVYLLDKSQNYVLKIMRRDHDFNKMFENEINVGSLPKIEKVGARIHCTYSSASYHAYIMDHIVKGEPKNTMFATLQTIRQTPKLRNSLEHDVLYAKFAKVLVKFYKVTQGYHGDLHLGNVMVLYTANGNRFDMYKVKIIDYGTYTKFKKKLPKNTDMMHAIDHAHQEWLKLPTTPKSTGFPGIRMKHTNYGAIRSNKNLLEFDIKHKKSPFGGILQKMILGWTNAKSKSKNKKQLTHKKTTNVSLLTLRESGNK